MTSSGALEPLTKAAVASAVTKLLLSRLMSGWRRYTTAARGKSAAVMFT